MSSSSKTRSGKRKTRENVEVENVQNTDENSFDIENIEPEVPQAETPSKKLKEEMFKALKVNIEESEKRMSKMIRDVLGTVLRERDENVPSSSSSSNIISESENEVNSVIDISNETANSRNMVTGVLNNHTPPQMNKKNRSSSQPEPRVFEQQTSSDVQKLLEALTKMANPSLNNFPKIPKTFSTAMPTFDGKNEKFELFEDLFNTSLKTYTHLTPQEQVNYFHSLMRGDALQTFKNLNEEAKQNVSEVIAAFRRKYVKPQSRATARMKWQKLVFDPRQQKFNDFLDEMHKLAKEAYGEDAQRTIEQSIYAKLPTNLRKTVNQAQLEDGTYEQIVRHIEREIELNGADPGDDLAIVQLSHVTEIREEVQTDDQKRNTCFHCKNPGTINPNAEHSKNY